MRKFALLSAILLLASPAVAVNLEFSGSSELQFSNLGQSAINDTGTGIAIVNGSGSVGHLNTLQLTTNFATLNGIVAVTDPIVTAGGIVEVRLTSVQADPVPSPGQGGIFAPISGALQNTALGLSQNTMASSGFIRICLFVPGCGGASLDLTLSQTVNGARIGAGIGGVLTIGAFGPIRISIIGAPWTVKTASISNRTDNGNITTFTKQGFAHGPASLTSSTAVTSGVVQLVVPSQSQTTGVPGNSDKSGNITTNTIHFIPEPGLLLLLGAGAVATLALGRKRMKR